MDFIEILNAIPHSILLWKILSIFFGGLCLYLSPAAWSYWVNQKIVESNIDKILSNILSFDDYKESSKNKLIDIITTYSEIRENYKIVSEELKVVKSDLTNHNSKLESFIDKVEFMMSLKSNIDDDDDIFKVINNLQKKKRKIDRY